MCLPTCKLNVCGDGKLYTGVETCDDGNMSKTDLCFNCKPTFCGDGTVQNPNGEAVKEKCDDGNQNNLDECNNMCLLNMPA